jgi:hypothetical protein
MRENTITSNQIGPRYRDAAGTSCLRGRLFATTTKKSLVMDGLMAHTIYMGSSFEKINVRILKNENSSQFLFKKNQILRKRKLRQTHPRVYLISHPYFAPLCNK